MTNKTGSWGADETVLAVTEYDGGNGRSVEAIAADLGRSKRSVQGKLTAEKVYVVPTKAVAAKKDDGPTKGEIITSIKATGRFEDVDGLNGTTKGALKELLVILSA